MNKTLAIAVVLLTSVASFAQSSSHGGGSGSGVGISTVANAPTGKAPGTLNVMIDGSTGTDCTVGGGANFVLCRYSGTVWGTFTAGTAGAGGAASTLQFSNAGTLGGISQFTTNGTTTITGSATSVFDLHAAGVGGLLLPGALATGIVKVTTATGAISILPAPNGTVVGTSDTQALTNKDLTGAGNTFPTFNQNTSGTAASATNFSGSLVGDVTGTQGATVVAKINGNSVTTGAANNQVLVCTGASTCVWKTLPDCVSSSNALNFTAATNVFSCLSITTLSNPMTTLGDVIYGGAAGAVTRLAGPTTPNGVPQVFTSIPAAGAAVAEIWNLPGISGRAITGTTATDTIASTDCSPLRIEYVGSVAVAVTLPTATTLAVPKCVFKLTNNLSTLNDVTVTPTTWTVNGGASVAIHQGQVATFYVDSNSATNWVADVEEEGLSAGSNITFTRSSTGLSIASTGGGVTSVATTSPITGGTITTTGTIACATCTTSAAALTLNQLLFGAGSQGMAVGDLTGDVTTAGGKATTIAANAVSLAKMATQANATLLSNVSGVTAVPSANALPVTANALIKTSNANGALASSTVTDNGTVVATTEPLALGSAQTCTTFGTAGSICPAEGTAPTNVAGSQAVYADSTAHELEATTNGGSIFGIINRTQPAPANETAKTATDTAKAICTASAGGCNVAGQYTVSLNVWGSGTACSSVTAGSVVFTITWVDENGTTHTAVPVAPFYDFKTAAVNATGTFNFNTALTTEGASAAMVISTNGSAAPTVTGTYTACTTGTGTYNFRAAMTRLQ